MEIEEERRICYVGLTRSIENLFLTAPIREYSQFLKELLLNPVFYKVQDNLIMNSLTEIKQKEKQLISKIKDLQLRIRDIKMNYPEIEGNEFTVDITLKTISQEKEIGYLLKKYPELSGHDVVITFPLFKDYFLKRKLETVKKASIRIEDLKEQIKVISRKITEERKDQVVKKTQEIDRLNNSICQIESNDLKSIRDKISSINLEMSYRLLLKNNW